MSDDKKVRLTLTDEDMVTSPRLSRRTLLAGVGIALGTVALAGRSAMAEEKDKADAEADKGDAEDDKDKGDAEDKDKGDAEDDKDKGDVEDKDKADAEADKGEAERDAD
jgi:hypothetical protein